MFFSMAINLFFCFVVGSDGSTLYVGWFNKSSDFFSYSSLSMTTILTPISAISTILSWSFFSSFIALASSLDIFDFGGLVVLMMALTSALSSSPSPCVRLWHTLSIWATYSPMGGSLVTIA